MQRFVTIMVVLGLSAAACGGDDDTAEPDTTAPDVTTTVASTEAAEESSDDSASDDSASDDVVATTEAPTTTTGPDDDATADDTSDGDAGDDVVDGGPDDDGDGSLIRSIGDIPDECLDLMAGFLRDIEPAVSPVDWDTVSLADVEDIGAEFEQRADEYETASEEQGCNDLQFDGDTEYDLMVEFARDVAPGTVGFLEFIAELEGFGETDLDVEGDTSADAADDGFATCQDAIDFVQGLVDTYDTVNDVPAAELLRFQNVATIMISCTPDQLEFFNQPGISDFFGG